MEERLQKILSAAGICSRRASEAYILAGRVTINDQPAQLGQRADPDRDDIRVDGRPLTSNPRPVYLMLNKPRGYVTTLSDEQGRPTVAELVADAGVRVYPVGRLDLDSEGLLLMTNDGEIVNRILRAAGGHEKEYVVTVNKVITDDFLKQMAEGVPILDTVTLPCRIIKEDKQRFRIILVQGLNRQIRRMCEALGYRVTHLTRERVMNIQLGHLKPGHWRNLTPAELDGLMAQL